jgi:hypothetical protein
MINIAFPPDEYGPILIDATPIKNCPRMKSVSYLLDFIKDVASRNVKVQSVFKEKVQSSSICPETIGLDHIKNDIIDKGILETCASYRMNITLSIEQNDHTINLLLVQDKPIRSDENQVLAFSDEHLCLRQARYDETWEDETTSQKSSPEPQDGFDNESVGNLETSTESNDYQITKKSSLEPKDSQEVSPEIGNFQSTEHYGIAIIKKMLKTDDNLETITESNDSQEFLTDEPFPEVEVGDLDTSFPEPEDDETNTKTFMPSFRITSSTFKPIKDDSIRLEQPEYKNQGIRKSMNLPLGFESDLSSRIAQESSTTEKKDEGGLSSLSVVIISCGVAVVFIALVAFFMLLRLKRAKKGNGVVAKNSKKCWDDNSKLNIEAAKGLNQENAEGNVELFQLPGINDDEDN